jgi:hypothetical protein
MAMPQMTAEHTLYASSGSYHSTGVVGAQASAGVVPQQGWCTPCILGQQLCVNCRFKFGWPPVECDSPTIRSC